MRKDGDIALAKCAYLETAHTFDDIEVLLEKLRLLCPKASWTVTSVTVEPE